HWKFPGGGRGEGAILTEARRARNLWGLEGSARQGEVGGVVDDGERRRRGEALIDRFGAAGAAEAVALHHVHAGRAQEELLLGRLDAFGGHLHAETAAEADHGVDDRGRIRGALDRVHEAAVDLELVEREAAQIEQARITGTEIVERKPHAERL